MFTQMRELAPLARLRQAEQGPNATQVRSSYFGTGEYLGTYVPEPKSIP